ncbi:MAG TPA: hypothetical protein VFU15_03625 [Bacteroidia bacterium]|nr:hypothetical protein [Bacteroidia bacterium]
MRTVISASLLLLYTCAVLRPLYPFADYLLNRNYIANVLCENRDKPKMHCNGKCHLMKELKKSVDDDPKAPAPSRTEVKYETSLYTIDESMALAISAHLTGLSAWSDEETDHYASCAVSDIFRPPKA